jgi:Protein of unknown function (DUF3089)
LRTVFLYLSLLSLTACKMSYVPQGTFEQSVHPKTPDYSQTDNWAALPDKSDAADLVPPSLKDGQSVADADVFFIYPTVYTGKKKYQTNWNAPVDYAPFNQDVDLGVIKYQASIFNSSGKIYAPRYRQAHIKCYWMPKERNAECLAAFDLAYQDVKRAFEYYMKYYNNGRPIIIAGHSQGTTQGMRLVKEFFDGKPLQNRLVAAYLVGIPIPKDYFKTLKVCDNPDQTSCFCSWRTFQAGYEPTKYPTGNNIAVVNPLTWTTDEKYADASRNKGGVVKDFVKIRTGIVDAQIHNGILWATKPKFPGSFLLRIKNYHIGDYNLYYMNVRENAERRVKNFYRN